MRRAERNWVCTRSGGSAGLDYRLAILGNTVDSVDGCLVFPRSAVDSVALAVPGLNQVVSRSSEELVPARSPVDDVVAGEAEQAVIAAEAEQAVRLRCAAQEVGAGGADPGQCGHGCGHR